MTSLYSTHGSMIERQGTCDVWRGPTTASGHPRIGRRTPSRLAFAEHFHREPAIRSLVSLCGVRLCIRAEHHADCMEQIVAGRTVIDGECLVWTGETSNDGYPRQRLGVFWMVHRWVWINAHHDIPEGMQIDHICNRRACVELAHLRCVTPTENAFAGHSNTPAAINARKTHCIRGHPFEGENLVIEATGKGVARVCRRCRNDRKARARAARRALALAGALRG